MSAETVTCPHCHKETEIYLEAYDSNGDDLERQCNHCAQDFMLTLIVTASFSDVRKTA